LVFEIELFSYLYKRPNISRTLKKYFWFANKRFDDVLICNWKDM